MTVNGESAAKLGRILAAADPATGLALDGEQIDCALDALGIAITAGPPASRRPRRVRRSVLGAGLAAAALVIGGGVAAAAAVLSAHTGRTMPPSQVDMGGPGEILDPAAPDFRTVALQIASDIPYPAGDSSWRDLVVADAADPSGMVSSGALHGWFAMSAFCAWVRDWDQAAGAGDTAEASLAARNVAAAPGWAAVTAEDPHPDPSAANDPGAETGTLFGWLLPYRAAVLADDRDQVEHLLATGYGDGRCSFYDPTIRAQQSATAKAARG